MNTDQLKSKAIEDLYEEMREYDKEITVEQDELISYQTLGLGWRDFV